MILEVPKIVFLAIVTSIFTFFLGFALGQLARKQAERSSKADRQ
jgi:hypothetical protein